jgi:hypothetical protein
MILIIIIIFTQDLEYIMKNADNGDDGSEDGTPSATS